MIDRKKCQLGCLKTGVRELKMLVCACLRVKSNIFGSIWVKFLKINRDKTAQEMKEKTYKNMKEEEKISKEKNSYILWDFKTHETSNSLQPWASTALL